MAAATAGRFSVAPRGKLDPSGLVKGWAIERASALLTEAGLPDHHINGGGDVQLCGGPAPGEPWRVGLADPLEPGELITVVSGRDLAVATSGTAERGRHIIDARTGRAATALASITLVGRHLTDVDALATAAFVMGADARAWAEAWPGIEALAVTRDHSAWRTSGFERFTTRDGLDLLPG